MTKQTKELDRPYFHMCTTKRQIDLLLYYIELGLSIEDADMVIHTAWMHGYLYEQIREL